MQPIRFFSLSTCVWCRKTRQYLDENSIPYELISVDQLTGKKRETVLLELAKYNPNKSFPTLVFTEGQVVIGFKPEEIRKAISQS